MINFSPNEFDEYNNSSNYYTDSMEYPVQQAFNYPSVSVCLSVHVCVGRHELTSAAHNVCM